MNKYADIIKLPHPVSRIHKPMSLYNRAAQFAPYAALVGYDKTIEEVGREVDDEIELSEDRINDINTKLIYLNENKDVEATYTYFLKDRYKKGGSYLDIKGRIKKIDLDNNLIILKSNKKISIEDIVDIII